MWTYHQTTGVLADPTGEFVGTGYSGFEDGKDNPALQSVADTGPIPQGIWMIGDAETHAHLGEVVMALTPAGNTDTYDRSGFFIHGDSGQHPGLASHGCVVLSRAARQMIAASPDKQLEVVS